MTTSGSYSTGLQAGDLLTEAWERIGKSPAVLTGDAAASARRSLGLMLIDWTNRGVPLGQVEQITVSLTVNTIAYTLPTRTADILDAYVTVSGADRYLARMSRYDYAALPLKTTAGTPTQIWVDRQNAAPVMRVYPAPDGSYTVTAYTLRLPQDVTAILQTADAPVLWSEALAAGLAARLAEKYAPERLQEKIALAEAAYARAYGEDRERVPMSILPDRDLA